MSGKTDLADTVPYSLWCKLFWVQYLRPNPSPQLHKSNFGAEGQAVDIKNSLGCKMIERVCHLPLSKLPTSPPLQANCFCPGAHLSNNSPRSVWSHSVWAEQKQTESISCWCGKRTADWGPCPDRLRPMSRPQAKSPASTHHREQPTDRKTQVGEISCVLENVTAPDTAQIASLEWWVALLSLFRMRTDSHL